MVSPGALEYFGQSGSPGPLGLPVFMNCSRAPAILVDSGSRSRAAAAVGQHQIRVVEPERDIDAVERAHAVIEQRRLPGEPIDEHRRGLLGLHIRQSYTLCRLLLTKRPDLHRLPAWEGFRVSVDDFLRFIAEAAAETRSVSSVVPPPARASSIQRRSIQLIDCSFWTELMIIGTLAAVGAASGS